MTQVNSVNIRPGVNVLAAFPHLNYKAWYALAEFVDNSIQSSIDHKKKLSAADNGIHHLRVDIEFDAASGTIIVRDNAAGISSSDYSRAFRPAEIPPNATGLSEFGMGMKSAACWFAPNWSVRSSALGENVERTVIFDIEEIVHDSIEELNVLSMNVSESKHYTEIRLEHIRNFPRGKTIQKIKEHLSSIYRVFIRDGQMSLYVDGQKLQFEDPAILNAPSYRDPDGPSLEWKKEFNFDLGNGKSATGFVAIRETASTKLAGLALFRRKRLIMGSADEAYRPEDIFGRPNTFPYQRIFGEVHLKGFAVSHTKDGIKWEESEDDFLSKLREILTADELPILPQVREYRTKKDAKNARKFAVEAARSMAARFDLKRFVPPPSTSDRPSNDSAEPHPQIVQSTTNIEADLAPLESNEREEAKFEFVFRGEPWVVQVELSYSEAPSDWLSIQSRPSITDPQPRHVLIRVAMLHPFMMQFPNLDPEGFSAVLNIAATMALSEVVATELASHHPDSVRRFSNEILRNLVTRTIRDE